MIHITDSQTDRILDFIDEYNFWEDEHYKSLKDTLETFNFVTFANKRHSEHLAKRNRIIIPDEDGKYVEFIINNTRKFHDENGLNIEVYTHASYIELTKAKVIKSQVTAALTAKQHADWALAGTEWEVGDVDFSGSRTLIIEEHTNPYSFLKRLASEFDLELHFRVEVDGTKVVRRYVDLIKRVGVWQGREVEFGKDLIGISREEDFSNIVTALIGLGPEREDGTRLEVFVEDKDALARWGRNGQHLVEVYEPESTDQTMTEARLRELTQNELEKRINSIVEYTADIADLEKVPGLEHEKIRFGDTIKIKDTTFTPALYLEARVHTVSRSIKQNGYKTITLGDYIEYTEEQVFAIWKALQAEIAKKVSLSDVMEVTYTKTEIDDKDAGVYQDSTQYSDIVSETKKQEAIQVAAVDATNKANLAEQAARAYADSLKQQTDQQIHDVEQSLSDLDTYVDGAFKDSVIQEAEAKAIEKYLNQLNAEKADIDAKYNDVYNNPSLSGTAKTNLSSKKSAYNTAHTNLINAINTAISDGKTTPAEKSDVDTKFSGYRTALSQLSTAFEDAIDAIAQTKAQQAENNAKSHADSIAEQKKQEAINAAIADADAKLSAAKTELEADIALKADAEWVNGQLVLKENAITKSNTAPASPTTGQLWLDTSVTPNVLKRWSGSAWVKATPTSAGEVGAYTKTEVDNALNSKVSVTQYNTDMNGVITRLDSAESRITQTENEIATKVSNTTYQQDKTTINNNISQLQTKMSNAETSISQLSNQIALKANATDVYTKSQIDGQFNTVNQQISQLDAELSVQADQIATKVSRTEFEALQIGGRNWLRGTGTEKSIIGENRSNQTFTPYYFVNNSSAPIMNKTITVSFDWRVEGVDSPSGTFYVQGNNPYPAITNKITLSSTNKSGRVVETRTITGSPFSGVNFRLDYVTAGAKLVISNMKIEIGNRATDWTPAPEDVQGQIDGLGTRVNSAETSITQLSNQIQLKANQSTVDTLANRISSAESTINLLSDEIDLKVNKDGVISAINVSSEGIRISGNKVTIDGTTSIANGVIKTAHIGDGQITNAKIASLAVDDAKIKDLSVSKLKAGMINADQVGIGNDKVTLNSNGVTVKEADFLTQDPSSNLKSSIIPLANLLEDHSFEMIPPGSPVNSNYDIYRVNTSYFGNLGVAWSPSNESNAQILSSDNGKAKFGNRAVVLRGQSYCMWDQFVDISKLTDEYFTLSAYVCAYEETTSNVTPSIRLQALNSSGNWLSDLSSSSYTLNYTQKYKWVRIATTARKSNMPSGTAILRVRLLLNNDTSSAKALCDGVQLVLSQYPTIYQPEESLYGYLNGYSALGYMASIGGAQMSIFGPGFIHSLSTGEPITKLAHAFLALQNGWSNYGGNFQPARYSKSADGWVHLSGLVRNGTIGSALATLPAGCRPRNVEIFRVASAGAANGLIYVYPDGRVVPIDGHRDWISLSGVAFLGEN
ncbi:phage tail spike protein [Aeribacillus composti]|uniref:phage tail spike protein n=1 Tax=Aeribacillus composti TaxID=1868734 RepID=UPI00406A8583